jgi:uncharacterized protein (DUF885 family)
MQSCGRMRWGVAVLQVSLWAAALSWTTGAVTAATAGARTSGDAASVAPAGDAQAGNTESQRFAAFLQDVYQRNLVASPQLATEFGSKAGDDRWDDTSEAALAADAARVRGEMRTAKTRFDYAKLDPASQLQYRVFLDEHRLLLDRYRWRDHFYALNQIVGLHIDVPGTLAGNQVVQTEQDAEAYIRRIRAVQPAFRELMRHMQAQARQGIYIPKMVYPLLIEGAQNVITGAPHDAGPDSPILADFKRRVGQLDVPAEGKERLIEEARKALLQQLQPAYAGLIQLLKTQAGRTPITGGVWQLPDGDAFYAFLIRQFTTTDMTPAQIHEMGLAEMARSQREIAALMDRVGFKGTVREFMAKMKSDPHNYESDDDAGRAAYLAKARRIVAAMQAKITDAFEAPAPLPLRIVRTEAYKEASSPPGFYEAGAADGSRPGSVYLNLSDMKVLPLYELEDLLYHEGIPGHHMQISTILVDRSIPQLRKVNEWWQDSAFVEGWGLYAERLGKDLGFYQDPYSEFGLLTGELWRASRLVVDSGLHYKHWTREQAIQYLNENTPSAEATNIRAVDRYLAVPGQATSFMVGMRKFVAERERARQALGSRFDLREYHHVALSSGYIPLWALDQKVSSWIESKSGTAGAAPRDAAPLDAGPQSPNAAFNQMLEDYWQEYLGLNPIAALSHGDNRDEGRFDESLQDAWRVRTVAMLDKYLQASAAYSADTLSQNDRTSLAMLREQLTLAKDFYSGALFETSRMLPLDQFQGRHTEFAADAAGSGAYPFKTLADYERQLDRADAFAKWTDDASVRMREGIKAGVVLPRMIVQRILPQLQSHFGLPPEKTEFWQPLANFPAAVAPADRARLEKAYRIKIATVIEPAYRRLFEFMQNEYLPHARESVGLGQMPGGAALYNYDVRFHTTTQLTPSQIHAIGVAEVTRIETEFAKVQAAVGFKGTLQEFFAKVRADPALKFTSRDQIIPAFEADRQIIVAKLPKLFDVWPRAEFQIRALPDSSKNSQGNGYYSAAGADGSRPGILWINTYAPGISDKFNVMTLVLHEGMPGHHFQTSVAQEQARLPSFRRFDFTNAYGEGWALYAETLGNELGLFDDPWNYYGHLNYAIMRANRLVIDTGLHAMGWDVETGIQWMMQHSSMTRDQSAAEVERYVAYPGQALSYKLGELKIRELRRRAEQELGAKFDLQAFHDQILLGGSMPLTILEQRVDRWISATRTR